MAGTKLGGQAAAITNKSKYGPDFYSKIGKSGGLTKKTRPAGFSTMDKERHMQISSAAGKVSAPGVTKKQYLERVKKYAETHEDK